MQKCLSEKDNPVNAFVKVFSGAI